MENLADIKSKPLGDYVNSNSYSTLERFVYVGRQEVIDGITPIYIHIFNSILKAKTYYIVEQEDNLLLIKKIIDSPIKIFSVFITEGYFITFKPLSFSESISK